MKNNCLIIFVVYRRFKVICLMVCGVELSFSVFILYFNYLGINCNRKLKI